MRFAVWGDDYRVGVVQAGGITDITSVFPPHLDRWPKQRINWMIEFWDELRPAIQQLVGGSPLQIDAATVTLRAANPLPRQMFALPANFRAHLTELGDRTVSKGRTAREQGFFLKAAGSVVGASETILLPRDSPRRFDHECEIAVIVGASCRDVPRDDAWRHVFGFAALIDVTLRIEPGAHEEERTMRKSFETFTPLGPHLVTADEVGDLSTVVSELLVNGETRQRAPLEDLIVSVPEAIELVSSVITLLPGDVIAMGTPSGVGPLQPGDEVVIRVDRIGEMRLPVAERDLVSPRAY